MYTYHLVNGFSGEPLEPLVPVSAPSWIRRPEPVAWSAGFHVRPEPRPSAHGVTEGNPMAGLQHRVHPWRDVIVVSWQRPDGSEVALAAGIVTATSTDEAAGTLTVDTVCLRTLMDDRFLMVKNLGNMTAQELVLTGQNVVDLASQIVRHATENYRAIPENGMNAVTGFSLPIDRPTISGGHRRLRWWGYQFKPAGEALADLEDKHGVSVDFRPYWTEDGRMWWALEVFRDLVRTDTIMDLGSTGATSPQAIYGGTKTDAASTYTYQHITGKGSEADILSTRSADPTPTIMARETLVARPDVESFDELAEMRDGINTESRRVVVQDRVSMRVSDSRERWLTPEQLRLGGTVMVTLEDSLAYGHTTLARVLIGWKSAGADRIDLELADLTPDVEQ